MIRGGRPAYGPPSILAARDPLTPRYSCNAAREITLLGHRSWQHIEWYRKLLDISTDEPERRLIFKLLATQAIQMDANSSLTVRVERRGDKYTWELGRVEDWRAGVGRSLCSLLSRPFVCECHTISTMPRFQPPPRRTQRADFLALRSPVCFASRLMGPILPERLGAENFTG
jgi:hypothetical protein